MVCGENLASPVTCTRSLLLLLGAMVFCPCPKQGEWSSWLRHPRHFCHHGLVWSMVFSESLEMFRLRPLDTAVDWREDGVLQCQAGHGRPHSCSWRWVWRLPPQPCLLCVTFTKRACWNSCLLAPCLVDRLSTDFGYLPQFLWILGPLLERSLLQVDPLSTPGSWWRL